MAREGVRRGLASEPAEKEENFGNCMPWEDADAPRRQPGPFTITCSPLTGVDALLTGDVLEGHSRTSLPSSAASATSAVQVS